MNAARGARVRASGVIAGLSLERELPLDLLADYVRGPKNLIWVDVADPGQEELSLLREVFGVHPRALDDVAREQQRPRVDEYTAHIFAVVHAITSGADVAALELREVDLIFGPGWLVTIHRGEVAALDEALARWARGGTMLEGGIGYLVYTVVDCILEAYFPLSDAIAGELDAIEASLMHGPRDATVERFLAVRRAHHAVRRVLCPLRDVFAQLRRSDHPLFARSTQVYFEDIHDHALGLLDALDVQRDQVAGTTDVYLMMAVNRSGALLRAIAVIAAASVTASVVLAVLWGWS